MKRGLANVIATFSLVLLVVVAVAVIWIVIQNIIYTGVRDISTESDNFLDIGSGTFNENGGRSIPGDEIPIDESELIGFSPRGDETKLLSEDDFIFPGRNLFLHVDDSMLNEGIVEANIYRSDDVAGSPITGNAIQDDILIDTITISGTDTEWIAPTDFGKYYFVVNDEVSPSIVIEQINTNKVNTISSGVNIVPGNPNPIYSDLIWQEDLQPNSYIEDINGADGWIYFSNNPYDSRDNVPGYFTDRTWTTLQPGNEYFFDLSWVVPRQSSIDIGGNMSVIIKRQNGEELFRIDSRCFMIALGGERAITIVSGRVNGVWVEMDNTGYHGCPHSFAKSGANTNITISHFGLLERDLKIKIDETIRTSYSTHSLLRTDLPFPVDDFNEPLILEFQIEGPHNYHHAMTFTNFKGTSINSIGNGRDNVIEWEEGYLKFIDKVFWNVGDIEPRDNFFVEAVVTNRDNGLEIARFDVDASYHIFKNQGPNVVSLFPVSVSNGAVLNSEKGLYLSSDADGTCYDFDFTVDGNAISSGLDICVD